MVRREHGVFFYTQQPDGLGPILIDGVFYARVLSTFSVDVYGTQPQQRGSSLWFVGPAPFSTL